MSAAGYPRERGFDHVGHWRWRRPSRSWVRSPSISNNATATGPSLRWPFSLSVRRTCCERFKGKVNDSGPVPTAPLETFLIRFPGPRRRARGSKQALSTLPPSIDSDGDLVSTSVCVFVHSPRRKAWLLAGAMQQRRADYLSDSGTPYASPFCPSDRAMLSGSALAVATTPTGYPGPKSLKVGCSTGATSWSRRCGFSRRALWGRSDSW